ncbi:hypothetical protein B9T33_02425 [Acinetobacter sp. ANC 5054]|uniref:hypothetical protein n=1 Tax=Acinetobacter sp. ANC 5054 TaxID=1977877 RepID=UPI000A3399CF|nr:hypothetical protein [Acinetobacter sp. ANC 5054]OTG83285.1 hypothetical protein B9T33_02425 [Acinetobacter sp. ANC 5054]
MNNIITSSLAYEALMAGKHVMCRPVGDMLNFNDLDQFPATIFAKEGYEFCIKIETIEVAGITFTKPLKLDEVQVGDDIYIVQASGEIHHYKYVECHEILNQSIARGFAQRDLENAKLQAEAFCKLFDREYRTSNVIDIPEQSKKRTRKSKIDESNKVQTQTANDVEEKPFKQSAVEEIETDPVKLVEKFTMQINACNTNDAVLALRPVFMANGHLEREHTQHLCKLTEDKLLELDPKQYTPKPNHTADNLSVEELKSLQIEAEKLAADKKLACDSAEADYQNLLNDLLTRATNAPSPREATALTGYTRNWTEAQRKPLLDAIHKRLRELAPTEAEIKTPPSLMVQIQNAPDLTALNALEIDVSARSPEIQPKLMDYVKKRRFELENQVSEAAQ